jgi:dihydroorotase
MKTILNNARIVCDKTKKDFLGHLIIEGEKISAINKGFYIGNEEVIDCKGHVLSAGLIDIQVHFRDPGQAHKEDMATGSLSAVRGGITTVVCQPNTNPTLDSITTLDYLYYKAKEHTHCNILAYASITKGLQGGNITELSTLAKHPIVCGFTDDGLPVMNSLIMRRALEFSQESGVVIAQHAEDINLSQHACMNEGMVSATLGVKGQPNAAESIIVQRDIELLRAVGGKYHVLHVSTKESLNAIRLAKKEGLNITCEASPHHLVLTDEAVLEHGTNAKMNPPLRKKADVLALQEALIDGTVDAIATDHAPHSKEEKSQGLEAAPFGIAGVETMLPIALEFYHSGKITLTDLLSKMTWRPAKIINFDGSTLEIGKKADLTLIDLNQEWVIDVEKFASKSKNSPFHGRNVKGKALMTIVNGKIKFRENI